MKKTILLILMSVFILPLFSNQANASTYSNIKMYLGDNVELTKNDSIYQSNSIINEGLSKVYHVLEIGNVSNEFVRLAKFDSNLSHNYTAVNVKARIALLYGTKEVDVLNYNETVSVNLLGGNAYNFILQGSIGEPIQFSVTKVENWIENWIENNTQYTPNN